MNENDNKLDFNLPGRPLRRRGRTLSFRFRKQAQTILRADSQRSKLYTAEGVLRGLPEDTEYPEMCQLERRVNQIVNSATWCKLRKEFGLSNVKRVRVHDGRRHIRAVSYGGCIAMPKWARRESVILHELAHELLSFGIQHQWPFAYVLLKLVSRFMGAAAGKALKASFKSNGVRFRPKRSRNLTPEQRAAAAERLKFARAIRAAKRAQGVQEA